MSVTKSMMEAYRVQKDHEWATIVVQGWQKPSNTGAAMEQMEQGEILIHSSFGSWSHQWGNLGRPMKQFLAGVTFDYLMGKLLPGELREFDFHASVASWKTHLVAARRAKQLSADEFREVWDASCSSDSCSIDMFLHRLTDSAPFELRYCPLWDGVERYIVCRDSTAAVAFWKQLWPEFLEALRVERQPANDAHPVAA